MERYSNQEIPQSLGKLELQKTVSILVGPYDRKTVFQNISSFNLQNGVILIQAHNTPESILLSVSLKISDELFQGLDRELAPPGLRYTQSFLNSQDHDSVLRKIENSAEGFLTFPNCLLVIKFTFPLEIMRFTPPVIDNSEP